MRMPYCEIRYVNTKENAFRNQMNEKIKRDKTIFKAVFLLGKFIVRGYGYLRALLSTVNINQKDVQAYFCELENIQRGNDIDVIIPTCLPFESIIAAIAFKDKCKQSVAIMPFLFDLFSKNNNLHRLEINKKIKFKSHVLLEKKVLDECDKILYVKAWEKHLETYFAPYRDKALQLEHPLLKRLEVKNEAIYDNTRINLVYAGTLYRKIRSPLPLLKFFSELILHEPKILLHFYIAGDCDEIVNYYCSKFPENIINHGFVSVGVAKAAMVNADLLLSIGNKDSTQLASKIFEYISTGNSIIHFYS